MQVILGLGGSMPHQDAPDQSSEARLGSMLAAILAALGDRGYVCDVMSSLYRSAGWQFPRTDRGVGRVDNAQRLQFWNRVGAFTIPRDRYAKPAACHHELQAIEAAFGRDRAQEPLWGARPLDIDILDYGSQIFVIQPLDMHANGEARLIARSGLVIPHIFLDVRLFVLLPLQEIRPDWVHPVSRLSVQQLIAQCERNPLLPPDRPVRSAFEPPNVP